MPIIPLGFLVLKLGIISVTRKAAAELDRFQTHDALTRHVKGDWALGWGWPLLPRSSPYCNTYRVKGMARRICQPMAMP